MELHSFNYPYVPTLAGLHQLVATDVFFLAVVGLVLIIIHFFVTRIRGLFSVFLPVDAADCLVNTFGLLSAEELVVNCVFSELHLTCRLSQTQYQHWFSLSTGNFHLPE